MTKIEETLKKIASATSRAGISTNPGETGEVTYRSNLPGDPNCPICGGIGFIRQNLPISHPDFGKLQPCTCLQGKIAQSARLRLYRMSNLDSLQGLTFGLRSMRCPRRDIWPRVERIAQLMNIDHLLQRKPPGLSGGERQRVSLARALVTEPKVLLLDEPLSALDPEAREKMQQELAEIHRRLNVTIIHVTHDFEEALSLGERVAVLNKGQVVQVGTPDDIMRRPNSEFMSGFALSRNVFQGIAAGAEDDALVNIGGMRIRIETTLRGAVHASIRPEDIFISREPIRSTAGDSFQGKITGVVDKGSVIYVTVSVPPNFTCLVSRQAFGELDLKTGMDVYITIRASAVHVF